MKCFYHGDADGKCAAFWVLAGVMAHRCFPNAMFCEINYDKPFPFNKIIPGEQIYIVDYSISPDEMLHLLSITKDVTWIDHHKTAIEKYADFPYNIRGIRVDGIAGCMLTYCYIYHMTQLGDGEIKSFDISMTKDAPYFTKLIADWDTWTFVYGDNTRYFHIAFDAHNLHPESTEWFDLFFTGWNNEQTEDGGLIEEGKTMMLYRDGWAETYCRHKGFETCIEGHKAFAMNLGLCNSEFFKSIDNGSYDILAPFSFNGEVWSVSLYSRTVDVSEIAKKYGGGGHKGAAGFTSKDLSFLNTNS